MNHELLVLCSEVIVKVEFVLSEAIVYGFGSQWNR